MREASRSRGRRSGPRAASSAAPLIRFAAAAARGRSAAAERAARRARAAGLSRRAALETAYMLILHAGFPAALEGTAALARAWPGTARRTREGGVADWLRRGRRRLGLVYGASTAKLVRNVTRLNPDLAAMMVEQGYGRVLSRPGLPARDRELVAVAVLAAGGWERQLVSHLLGARRLGASRAAIRDAWRAGVAGAAPAAGVAARRAWSAAFGRHRSRSTGGGS